MTKATNNVNLIKKLLAHNPEVLVERLQAETRVVTNQEKHPNLIGLKTKEAQFKPVLFTIKEEDSSEDVEEFVFTNDEAANLEPEEKESARENASANIPVELAVKMRLHSSSVGSASEKFAPPDTNQYVTHSGGEATVVSFYGEPW